MENENAEVSADLNESSTYGCLKEAYENANLITTIHLEEGRLKLLKSSLKFKRPIQSLRCRGFNALGNSKLYIQNCETRANLKAIEEKDSLIKKLKRELDAYYAELLSKTSSNSVNVMKVDKKLVAHQRKKHAKKLIHLQNLDETKWYEWSPKRITASNVAAYDKIKCSRKAKRKIKAKKRKLVKAERVLKQRANYALENNLVINFTNVDVPLLSIAILSYGPGWIPTPSFNQLQFKISGLNCANKQAWAALFFTGKTEEKNNSDSSQTRSKSFPGSLLRNEVTTACNLIRDKSVGYVKENISQFASDMVRPRKVESNMNKFEKEGLEWLLEAVKNKVIAVTLADKGGAILIVKPEIIQAKTIEKLKDVNRYKCVGKTNPIVDLKKKLNSAWEQGIKEGHVTNDESKKTVGLYINDKGKVIISPNDKFKPGTPFASPYFKVHKLSKDQLVEKVIPPLRLVTDLHDGVTARSDKFLVWRWLADLCKDYASDLVKDTTDALIKIEELNKNGKIKRGNRIFNIDVVSLYDSLNIELVLVAVSHAMDKCRPDWSISLRSWIKHLIYLSCKSGVVKSKDVWFESKRGIPTGGVPCVDIGNITVFYVLDCLVYQKNVRPTELVSLLRFVDDGLGFWKGSERKFEKWIKTLNESSMSQFGLSFTHEFFETNQFAQFLDIKLKFEFGSSQQLVTDIYRKPTDANRYLHFTSHHPRHVFSSVVYSAALRYRRIINNDETLHMRLQELNAIFKNSGYPTKMVNTILQKVGNFSRVLKYKDKSEDKTFITPWLTTYGPGFEEIKAKCAEMNSILITSEVWKEEANNARKDILKVVARRGPNLADMLFKRKRLALETYCSGENRTRPCPNSQCLCCQIVSEREKVNINGRIVKSAGGTCSSNNVVYLMQCKICRDGYVGKTVETLRERMKGHRKAFYGTLRNAKNISSIEIDDTNIVGIHLVQKHQKTERDDFGRSYEVTILSKDITPCRIRIVEQSFIDTLHTIAPFGMNQNNSLASF